jgi:cupin 2 domain-containing protein
MMSIFTNIFADIPKHAAQELFTKLLDSPGIRIERIVSYGTSSPEGFWYDQDHDEWVIVLQGAARLALEESVVELKPGDFLNLPAHTKHRVEWTTPDEPTIWLAIHYGMPSSQRE